MTPTNQFHVRFFNSRKELFSSVIDVLEKGDHVFLSGTRQKNTPLWHSYVQGTVLNLNKEKNVLKLDVIDEELFVDSIKRTKVKTSKVTTKNHKLSYYHGFRIDQERVFTEVPGLVKKYKLGIHPSSYALAGEKLNSTPAEEFVKTIVAGDYVTVWSEPDRHQKDFLHYPVQGWLWSKNEETMEIEFVHPPRMDIQKFSCHPSNKMIGYGYYRKLVYQLSSMDVKE